MKLSTQSLYSQAREAILDIIGKDYKFMSKIPSEQEISNMLGVSRNTIREALKSLENDGIILSRQGVGTFIIRDPKSISYDISSLDSTTKIILNQGYEPGSKTLYFDKRETSSHVSKLLEPNTSVVIYLERVRTADEEPVVYVEDYIPYIEGMSEILDENLTISIFQLLSKLNTIVSFSHCTIHSVLATDDILKKLELKEATALLLLKQIHYSDKGVPVLYSESYFLSEKFEFNLIRKIIN